MDIIVLEVHEGYKIDFNTLDVILNNGLAEEETVAVSDHYPVYAEFWIDRDVD